MWMSAIILLSLQTCFGLPLIETPGAIDQLQFVLGDSKEKLNLQYSDNIIDSNLLENFDENQIDYDAIEDEMGHMYRDETETVTPETMILMVVGGALGMITVLTLAVVTIFKLWVKKRELEKECTEQNEEDPISV